MIPWGYYTEREMEEDTWHEYIPLASKCVPSFIHWSNLTRIYFLYVSTQQEKWKEVTWHEYISLCPNCVPWYIHWSYLTRIYFLFLHRKKNGRKLLDMNIFPLPPIAPLLFSSHHFRELRQQASNNVIKNKNNNNNKHILSFLPFNNNALNQRGWWHRWKPFIVSSKNMTSKIISLLSI